MGLRRADHRAGDGPRGRAGAMVVILAIGLLAAGCAKTVDSLSRSPNLYSEYNYYPAEEVPEALRTASPRLFYVTDRRRLDPPGAWPRYGHDRSDALVFGQSTVRFGEAMGWADLVAFSTQAHPRAKVSLRVTENRELVRFPPVPLPFARTGGAMQVAPAARADFEARAAGMQRAIAEALRQSRRPEALIFVHGFRTSFDEGQATLADIWHFSGRAMVPIQYSWPSNNPGLFGYFKDRESGEFTVFHLKQFLTLLAAIPSLEKIHIVAHSRGADVTTTALRELIIAERAAGRDPRRTLKIDNLIMAAPDLDFGVVRQRLIAERFATALGRITVYLNKRDSALGVAQTLMSGVRMGRMDVADMDSAVRETFRLMGNVDFIDVERPGNSIGHSYFRENPAVVSDIVLTLRTSARPGGAERPLQPMAANFWGLHSGYPDPQAGSRYIEDLRARFDGRGAEAD